MKILYNRYSDYYTAEYFAYYHQEDDPVWNNEPKRVDIPDEKQYLFDNLNLNAGVPFLMPYEADDSYSHRFREYGLLLLVFCGEIYLISYRNNDKQPRRYDEPSRPYSEIKKELKFYFNVYDQDPDKIVEVDKACERNEKEYNYWSDNQKDAKWFRNERIQAYKAKKRFIDHNRTQISNLLLEYDSPCIVITSGSFYINPCLKDLDFDQIYTGNECAQKLDNYVNNILSKNDQVHIAGPDSELAKSKGFNNKSFRKDKSK